MLQYTAIRFFAPGSQNIARMVLISIFSISGANVGIFNATSKYLAPRKLLSLLFIDLVSPLRGTVVQNGRPSEDR